MLAKQAIFAGTSSLLIHCAEAYRDAGHSVIAVISSDPKVDEWAAKNGIDVVVDLHDPVLGPSVEFDFLFSIDEPVGRYPELVKRARSLAWAFADAPHPDNAIPHGPSWALIDGEKQYGVCWYDMATASGSALSGKQSLFEISDTETTWSLQAKCYEAGLFAFVSMVADLTLGSFHLPKIDAVEKESDVLQLPPGLGTLDFSRPAKALVGVVAALDFGPEPNPMGLAKIYLGHTFAAVRKAYLTGTSSLQAPGTVLRAEGDELDVATQEGDIRLTGCTSAAGGSLDGMFTPGMVLHSPSKELVAQLDCEAASLAKGERFWTAAYRNIAPVEFPYPRCPVGPLRSADRSVRLNLASTAPAVEVAAALCAWLGALTAQQTVSIMYLDPALAEQVAPLECWLSAWVPITLPVSPDSTALQAVSEVAARLDEIRKAGPCARDLPLRANIATDLLDRLMNVGVGVGVGMAAQPLPKGMNLMLACDAETSGVVLVADAHAFTPAVLQAMQSHFAAFLTHFLGGDRIGALPLTTDEDAAQTSAIHRPFVSHEQTSSVEALIAAQTQRTPDHEAVRFQGSALSYRELDVRAAALAARLRLRGVGRGHIVGLCLGRGLELVVTLLGIAKTGAAHLPLDPEYPRERLLFMVEDSETALVVTSQALATALELPLEKTFLLDAPDSPDAPHLKPAASSALAADMAYLMYTSGSTGKPKGVMVTQGNLLNLFAEIDAMMAPEPPGRWLAIGSVCFDISVPELWWTLTRGFTVVVHQRSEHQWSVAQDLMEHEITHFSCTPSMASMLVSDTQGRAALSRLSVLTVGGEALSLQLSRDLCSIIPGRVFNIYGPTETTVFVTTCELSPSLDFVPLGGPIVNTTVSVHSAWGAECPAWVPGELLIGGDGVSNGYWGRAELTADRFIDDPNRPGKRCYKSGDLVRRHPGGALEFLGRIDHQVKIRGHRIELGEIENVISQLPAVKETVVLAENDKFGDPRLVAYVVPKSGETLSSDQIQSAVASTLPAIMVPKIVMVLRAFTLTPNGKVDRRALPSARLSLPKSSESLLPKNPLERSIVAVWEQVLGIKPISPTDNLFGLGACFYTGLKAQRLLLESTGHLVHLADMLHFPTAERLAVHLDSAGPQQSAHTHSLEGTAITPDLQQLPSMPDVAGASALELTAVEAVVAEIWRDVFDIETIGKDDNFFSLGGNSLAAIRMFAQLRKQFPVELPLSTLFEAASLAGFSELVEKSCKLAQKNEKTAGLAAPSPQKSASALPAWSPLVQICRGKQRRPPLFCIHGAGGNVFNFKSISQKLGPDQAVYGLHPQGVDGHRPVLGSIELMAEQYVQAIQAVDPYGPYQLLGYSAGGVIAFEMAQQLRKGGHEIALLAMIDTLTPKAASSKPAALKKLWLMRKWSLDFAVQKFKERHSDSTDDASHALLVEKLSRGEWLTPELVEPYLFRHVVTVQANYRPAPYHGPMLLYKALDATTQYLHAGKYMGWDTYIDGPIHVTSIPGTHNSMMQEPGLSELSSALKSELDRLGDQRASAAPRAVTEAVTNATQTRQGGVALDSELSALP